MYDICIVGNGITGLICSYIFKDYKVCTIDPYNDGGDLFRKWGNVESNTLLQKTINSIKLLDPSYNYNEKYEVDKTAQLYIHIQIIKKFFSRYNTVDRLQGTVSKLSYINNLWQISYNNTNIISKTVLLCCGSNEKILNCDIPTIPLYNALNIDKLKQYIQPNEKVAVFGLSHSGTLVLNNLDILKVDTTAIYKTDEPFSFASDGAYDGIKEDAERIAKSILRNEFNYLKLVRTKNLEEVLRTVKKCSWVIYCIGFEKGTTIPIYVEEEKIHKITYDNTTGKIDTCQGIWGFGIAFPSNAPDNIHTDVGILSFVEHIQKQVNDIKHFIN